MIKDIISRTFLVGSVCCALVLSSQTAFAEPDCSTNAMIKDPKFGKSPELLQLFLLQTLSKNDFESLRSFIKTIPFFQINAPNNFDDLSREIAQIEGLTGAAFDTDAITATMFNLACNQLGYKSTDARIEFKAVNSNPFGESFYLQITYHAGQGEPAEIPVSIASFWADPSLGWPKKLRSGEKTITLVTRKSGGSLLINVTEDGRPDVVFQEPIIPRKLSLRLISWSFSKTFTRANGAPIHPDPPLPIAFPNANRMFVGDPNGSPTATTLDLGEQIIPQTISVVPDPKPHIPHDTSIARSDDPAQVIVNFMGGIDTDVVTAITASWKLSILAVK